MAGWMLPAATGLQALGGLLSGGGGTGQSVNLVSPEQRALLLELIKQQYAGADVGLGADLKTGQATLAQMMAGRGIPATSGVYQSALAKMTGQAVADAAQRRFSNLAGLVSLAPATTGAGRGYGAWGEDGGQWTPMGWRGNAATGGGLQDIVASGFGRRNQGVFGRRTTGY